MRGNIEFRQNGKGYDVWVELDHSPFEEVAVGKLRRDHEEYFRFYPSGNGNLTCKQCLFLSNELAKLNRMPIGKPGQDDQASRTSSQSIDP